jgi:hypothetical protein
MCALGGAKMSGTTSHPQHPVMTELSLSEKVVIWYNRDPITFLLIIIALIGGFSFLAGYEFGYTEWLPFYYQHGGVPP